MLIPNQDYRVSREWANDCTHLFMTKLKVTQKVIYALQQARHIVNAKWYIGLAPLLPADDPSVVFDIHFKLPEENK
jgi:hypothetical protein